MVIARGRYGWLLSGARVVAALGRWALSILPNEADPETARWTVTAVARTSDTYLLERGGPFELRLQIGQSTWRWREADASVIGEEAAVTGRGRPEVLEWATV